MKTLWGDELGAAVRRRVRVEPIVERSESEPAEAQRRTAQPTARLSPQSAGRRAARVAS